MILGANKQPSEPKLTKTHNENLHCLLPVLHRSDRWPAPVRPVTRVRPVDRAGQVDGYSSCTNNVQESLNDFSRPWNKNTDKTQPARKKNPSQNLRKTPTKHTRTDKHQHDPKTQESSKSPETNPTKGSNRLGRTIPSVRPVVPGQLGMNRTRGSTPPNPTPDLSIRFMDSHKTLGIVGTPHGQSIAKLWSTKTR
jgi:hypothetical protein